MKSRSFLWSAIILALGGFFAKAIGVLYKVPLTNILGSNGMGLYYLIFPVYSLIIVICSSGVSVALSTEVAKCRKNRDRYNEQKLLRVSLLFSFLLSGIFTIVVILLSEPLAYLQGNANVRLGYIAIAPSIILSSIIATLRGYFQGVENMIPTTISLIVEQIVKLSFGLILAHRLCIYGIQYAVLGAIIGVTISEVVALIIIAINFFGFKGQLYYNYRNMNFKRRRIGQLTIKKYVRVTKCNFPSHIYRASLPREKYTTFVALKRLLKVLVPATFSSIIIPIATMIDSFVIINLLVGSGYSLAISTSLYGLWGGVVQSFISLPIIVIAGLSTSLVPSLSGVVARGDSVDIGRRVEFFIKITWIMAIIMFVIVFVFAGDILKFLYGDGLNSGVIDELYYATIMLKISSVTIIYYAFMQTFTAILQAMGKPQIPVYGLLIGLMLRIILTVILVQIPSINIFGGIIAQVVFLVSSTIFMAVYLKKSIGVEMVGRVAGLPMVAGLAVMAIIYLFHMVLSMIVGYFSSMIISAILGLGIYIIWMYYGGIFSEKEKRQYFFRKKKLTKN